LGDEHPRTTRAPAHAAAGDAGRGSSWGAETRDGSSGKTPAAAPADNSEYRVNTSPPTAGGQVTLAFDIDAKIPGLFNSVASLVSDQTAGTTQVYQPLTVTP